MVAMDEAAETLMRCPKCNEEHEASFPDQECSLCSGSGLVSGKMAVAYRKDPPAEG